MASSLSGRALHGFVWHGEPCLWGSKDNDEAAELQLWYDEMDNDYCINARKTTRADKMVCKVIDVFTLHFQKYTDKIKTLLTEKSKFHFVQY